MAQAYRYPAFPDFRESAELLLQYSRLTSEKGGDRERIQAVLDQAEGCLRKAIRELEEIPEDAILRDQEPDRLEEIRVRRAPGPRTLCKKPDQAVYRSKLRGAFLGRLAGCTLGAPVEFWSPKDMEDWAAYIGDAFPPRDYWSQVKNPNGLRYGISTFEDYTRDRMDGVPVDDDISYTLLGLVIMEKYGPDFSTHDVGKAWIEYLPHACTAERVTLQNLRKGIPADRAALENNPYIQWIGGDIRSDPWAYMAPGLPELAAEFAFRDSMISHRRNGVYAAMFFAATISAAFGVLSAEEAFRAGLSEIPRSCLLAQDIEWALELAPGIQNYREAREATEMRFGVMAGAHANLNTCLTLFGLILGGRDFTKVIGETVAMGYDNDCTAATAGSLFGALYGMEAIPPYWYKPFHNKIRSYLIGHPVLAVEEVLDRFEKQAERIGATRRNRKEDI